MHIVWTNILTTQSLICNCNSTFYVLQCLNSRTSTAKLKLYWTLLVLMTFVVWTNTHYITVLLMLKKICWYSSVIEEINYSSSLNVVIIECMSLNQNILYKLERDMFISIMVRKEQVYTDSYFVHCRLRVSHACV